LIDLLIVQAARSAAAEAEAGRLQAELFGERIEGAAEAAALANRYI